MKNNYFDDQYKKTERVSLSNGRQSASKSERPPKSGGYRGYDGGHYKRKGKRRIPVALTIVIDILIAGLLFLLFYYLYMYDMGNNTEDNEIPSSSISVFIPSPTSTQTGELSPTISATVNQNEWQAKFADKFSSDGQIHQESTDDTWTYQSTNLSVNITKKMDNSTVYFVTDIYVADIKYFKTWNGFVPNEQKTREFVADALNKVNGVVGINGDFYPTNGGLTIRNKQYITYASSPWDELVMYNDGTMKTFTTKDFDWQSVKAQTPDKIYQVWGFGPMLLDTSGNPLTKFNCTVNPSNPRTAIGYYEPGHYCFVSVDGRQPGYSDPGYTTKQLAQLMSDLGCKVAFNLDGGGSSQLAFMGNEINRACSDKREDYDIIYITDQD